MKKLLAAAVAGATLAACVPAAASAAEPTVDAAVAAYNDLGLTQLTGMPSGRTTYRTYEEYNADMEALAAANPTLVAVKIAPYLSIEGRQVKYLEITNNVSAKDGKPVIFNMGAIHGNETPAAEDSIEFAYDVIALSKTNAKVKALLDKVRLIDMPIVNVDGYVHTRRANCNSATPLTPPATCPTSNSQGVDMNRNYPFGWGSNIGVSFAQRGSGPGSEPEVKNTMDIVQNRQVVTLLTHHTNSRAIFYPSLDIFAGQTPELNTGYLDLANAMNAAGNTWSTNVKDSAHDYETSGETIDWSYYATRGLAYTVEEVGSVSGCPQARPDYLNCTTADFTGTPGPASTATQTARFNGKPVRNMIWQALVYSSLASGHSVIKGTAPAGATLKITKDFNLFTAPIKLNTTPPSTAAPQAIPTHLESSLVVPANGQFTWDVNPSVRPTPAFEADGEHAGPRGFLTESWTLTCTGPGGTVLDTRTVTLDKGQSANLSLCTQGTVGGTVPATLALTLGAPASFGAFAPGIGKDYSAQTTATVISTAGDAALSVADPSSTSTGHLVNGTFSLPSPLLAGGSPLSAVIKTWTAPAANDPVTVAFSQRIDATDALRTGTYSKTLTFTLSTTTP
jgi:hypothetical protein